jgi:hypothetical protein
MDFQVHSQIGHKFTLNDAPRLTDLIQSTVRRFVTDSLVFPKVQTLSLRPPDAERFADDTDLIPNASNGTNPLYQHLGHGAAPPRRHSMQSREEAGDAKT